MDFGVGYFPTHDGIGPGALGRFVEERGQESLWYAEHTHIPYEPGGQKDARGNPLPQRYWHSYDLFVALATTAAATSKLRIGTGVCLIIERDPIITANEVASLDHLSGGRLEFGVGAGWNREEMRNHGTDPRRRMAVMQERVEAMKAIWTQEVASYKGEHVAFEEILSYPKPLQRPHPPVLVGGDGPTVLDRVLAFGDAWCPNYSPAPGFMDRIEELRARAGRPVEVDLFSAPADAQTLEAFRAAGVRRAIHWLPSGGRSHVERDLERWEAAIAEYNGE
jgi:probable F420-dependent oxidoreductase